MIANTGISEMFHEEKSWDDFENAMNAIVKRIREKELDIHSILALQRGGAIPGVRLSHKLHMPLQIASPDKLAETLAEMLEYAGNSKILLVDDIADTGNTMNKLPAALRKGIVICTWHYHQQSTVVPDIYIEEKKDSWIVYPWEK